MVDLVEIGVAIFCWLIISIGLYIYIDPATNPTIEKFNDFALFTIGSGILVIVVLFFIRSFKTQSGVYIISPSAALKELDLDEKKIAHIRRLDEMDILGQFPIEGGKKYKIKHILHSHDMEGRVSSFVVNCMSDFKSSADAISRTSRLESFTLEPMSDLGANRVLYTKTQTPVDKFLTAAKELKKIKGKGGETAVDLIEDLSKQEEERIEG